MIIKIDPKMIEDMKRQCQTAAEELEMTLSEINKIAELLEGGGLVGEGGASYVEALRGTLTGKVKDLLNKFEEIQRDLAVALSEMKESDQEVAKEMGD